jgi:membrane protein DedA with SNARE-associated domain
MPDDKAGSEDVRGFFTRRGASVLQTIAVIGIVAGAAIVLVSLFGGDGFGLIERGTGDSGYLSVFGLVAADAVIPIFPGETTLNAASTLAANGELELVVVILAGTLGAIVGDSALYWIARRSSARMEPQVQRARSNPKVNSALEFLDRGAPVLLTFGRYVPGLRFVINATMGMTEYPYWRFLPWSALGAVLWSTYTCVLAYKVGSTLDNYPAASIVISGAITTVLMGIAFLVIRRRDRAAGPGEGGAATT